MARPIVALVGRPNVGKSTLFNRIIGERVAIVEDVAGTTRDRLYYDGDWSGRDFTLIDTGGMEISPGSDLSQRIREQAGLAIREADVVVFLVDVREGTTSDDLAVAQVLHQSAKPVVIAANKADNENRRLEAVEYYRLGFGEVFPISALHGTGTGDLLDAVVSRLPKVEAVEAPEHLRVAVIGRPNVGKSSLVNTLVGEERVIVSDIPGTTRDAIDTLIQYRDDAVVLVDTAGIRRRGRIEQGIEKYSVFRTLRAIQNCDIALLLIDAVEGLTAQDTHLAGYVRDAYKGLVIVVNKWDLVSRGSLDLPTPAEGEGGNYYALVPRTGNPADAFFKILRADMPFVWWAPVLFASAKTGRNVGDILDVVFQIREERYKRVPTAALNNVVTEAVMTHQAPSVRGRPLKIYYATQAEVNPPTFVFFVNDPRLLHFSYHRYLENRLRDAFSFAGTPLKFVFRPRGPESSRD